MSGGCPVSATAGLSCCRRVSVPVPVPGSGSSPQPLNGDRLVEALLHCQSPALSARCAPPPRYFPLPPPSPPHPVLVQCQSQFCLRAAPLPRALPSRPLPCASPPRPPHLSAAATVAPEYLPVLKKSGQFSSSFKDCPDGDSLWTHRLLGARALRSVSFFILIRAGFTARSTSSSGFFFFFFSSAKLSAVWQWQRAARGLLAFLFGGFSC